MKIIGRRRISPEVIGSIKEGHLSCYYPKVKRELICVNGSAKLDMWERKGSPAQCAGANQNACAILNAKKNIAEKEK